MSVRAIQTRLHSLANARRAHVLQGFFKTGPGEYGEGDRFLGITVPMARAVAREFRDGSPAGIRRLLKSAFHEERLVALLILVIQFNEGNEPRRKEIYEFYLRHTRYINNWDLVDLSADKIVGPWLADRDPLPLYILAVSDVLWERRIAVLATFHFIKQGRFREILRIARMLLNDDQDLMHKAVGWMLREVGKRDQAVEEAFLKKQYRRMPRTMLRYAIERFPERRRLAYLNGAI